MNVIGSNVTASGDVTIKAGRDANVVSSVDHTEVDSQRSRATTGLIVGAGTHTNSSQSGAQQYSHSSTTEHASNITSTGGNVTITGTEGVNIYASRVSAGQSVNLTGGQVTVMSGVNDSQTSIATQSDSHSLTPNTLPHSLVSGINARSNETNTLEQTTLAGATLSGSKVNITATTGDVNLIAPTINAIQGVTLNATKGAVNFDVVNTTTEVSQDKGGKSLMYQRTSDSGVHTEAANYTQINSPNLTVDASRSTSRCINRHAKLKYECPNKLDRHSMYRNCYNCFSLLRPKKISRSSSTKSQKMGGKKRITTRFREDGV